MAFLSPRVLIQILCIFPQDLLNEVSARSSILRKTVRIPLVMILLCCAAFACYVNMLLKCAGELLKSDMERVDTILVISFCVVGLLFQPFSYWLVHIVLKYYDLLDVTPILMIGVMVFNIVEGLVILDEYSSYQRNELLGITTGIVLCNFGIIILLLKNHDQVKKHVTKTVRCFYLSKNEVLGQLFWV